MNYRKIMEQQRGRLSTRKRPRTRTGKPINDPYENGRNAAQLGRPIMANPFIGVHAEDWRRGWRVEQGLEAPKQDPRGTNGSTPARDYEGL